MPSWYPLGLTALITSLSALRRSIKINFGLLFQVAYLPGLALQQSEGCSHFARLPRYFWARWLGREKLDKKYTPQAYCHIKHFCFLHHGSTESQH